MSIIVPSNHTRIGAWVSSKMWGEKSTSILYNTINCHARISHIQTREAWVTTQFVTLHLGSDGCH